MEKKSNQQTLILVSFPFLLFWGTFELDRLIGWSANIEICWFVDLLLLDTFSKILLLEFIFEKLSLLLALLLKDMFIPLLDLFWILLFWLGKILELWFEFTVWFEFLVKILLLVLIVSLFCIFKGFDILLVWDSLLLTLLDGLIRENILWLLLLLAVSETSDA